MQPQDRLAVIDAHQTHQWVTSFRNHHIFASQNLFNQPGELRFGLMNIHFHAQRSAQSTAPKRRPLADRDAVDGLVVELVGETDGNGELAGGRTIELQLEVEFL